MNECIHTYIHAIQMNKNIEKNMFFKLFTLNENDFICTLYRFDVIKFQIVMYFTITSLRSHKSKHHHIISDINNLLRNKFFILFMNGNLLKKKILRVKEKFRITTPLTQHPTITQTS